MKPHHHTSFLWCRQKVRDKVRVNVVIRNHLRCICIFSQTLTWWAAPVTLSQYRVQFHLSSVWCPSGGQTLGLTAQTQTVPCIRFQTPLFQLLSLQFCSRPCLPRVRGIWMEILIPWSSPPLWGVLHSLFVTGEVVFLPDPVHLVVSDRNVVKQ